MLDDEKRKVTKIVPNVTITTISVGPDDDAVPLHKLPRRLLRVKPNLTKAEVLAVSKRLESMSRTSLPIPKGIDPTKARVQRR